MPYGTLAQVKALLPMLTRFISPTSNPSEAQIVEWLTQNSADLDGLVLTMDYPVPTSGGGFDKLAEMNALHTAWKTGYAFVNLSGKGQTEGNSVFDAYKRDYDDKVKLLRGRAYANLFAPTEAKPDIIGIRAALMGAPETPLFTRDQEF